MLARAPAGDPGCERPVSGVIAKQLRPAEAGRYELVADAGPTAAAISDVAVAMPRGGGVCQPDALRSRNSGDAIHPRLFAPRVRVVRGSDAASRETTDAGISDYRRGRRPRTSVDRFPGRSIRRRGAA